MRNRHLTHWLVLAWVLILSCGTTTASDVLPDLRTLFVEAEGEVKLTTVHNMPVRPLQSRIYWVDNHRIIYAVRQFKGWLAQKDERSKIVIFDVDSGAAEETPYRGDIACFGEEGQILVHDYPVPMPGFLLPGDTQEDATFT